MTNKTTNKMLALSCVCLLLLIHPRAIWAQSADAQDKSASTESSATNINSLSSQNRNAPDYLITIERNEANSKKLETESAVAQDNWEAVKRIPVGDEITVETRDGKQVKGRMSNISETSLTISSNKQPVSFDQPAIKNIYRRAIGGSRLKNTLLGSAVGTGIGGLIMAVVLASSGGSDSTGEGIAIGMALGAGIGTAVGLLTGKGDKKVLVYQAK
jgi:hypothetical protein